MSQHLAYVVVARHVGQLNTHTPSLSVKVSPDQLGHKSLTGKPILRTKVYNNVFSPFEKQNFF